MRTIPLLAFTLMLSASPAAEWGPVEEAAVLETPTGTLHGTLLLPDNGKGPYPVALIIAGSGPTDRDGNNPIFRGKNDSLKLLAEGLAAQGIASLRYDKRGIGESVGAMVSEAELRFDHLVDDAAAWIRQLEADPRFSKVTVIGHSEGSLIGMIATREAGADAFVSIAGVGRPAAEVLRTQLQAQLPPALMAEAERALTALEAGQTVDSVPPALDAVFRASVQPYLISWFRYDPTEEIARLEVPVLIVQGTTDIQVPVDEARTLEAARPEARLVIVEGMNHVLKEVPADPAAQMASYGDPSLPIAPTLVQEVAAFVR